jgi:hypothetical protein
MIHKMREVIHKVVNPILQCPPIPKKEATSRQENRQDAPIENYNFASFTSERDGF